MDKLSYLDVVRVARSMTSVPGVIVTRPEFMSRIGGESEEAMAAVADIEHADKLKLCSIKKVVHIAETYSRKCITTIGVTSDNLGNALYGYIDKYPYSFNICFKKIKTCYDRLFNLKEVMHIPLGDTFDDAKDAEHASATTEAEFIAMMALEMRDVVRGAETIDEKTLHHEQAAYLAALAVAFPWELRDQREKMNDRNRYSDYQFALAFMMPMVVAQTVKEDHYWAMFCAANERII